LVSPDYVALGEIGLDFTVGIPTRKNQEEVLRTILETLSRPRKILILHLRDSGKYATEASERALDLVQQCCGMGQPMHLHCFTGNVDLVEKWHARFPNCYFGFAGGLVKRFDAKQEEALRSIPSDRYLLETDAPYFAAYPTLRVNTPAWVGESALEVCRVRRMGVCGVLEQTLTNARRLYQFYSG
jgi:TatD DNase family protein